VPPPIDLRREPRVATPGRLALPVDTAVEYFRTALEAFDRGDLKSACEPLRLLRLASINVNVRLSALGPSKAPAKPSASSRRDDFDRLFEGSGE
jgi:hypothetical protein